MLRGSVQLGASDGAVYAAGMIRDAIRAGRMPLADVAVFVDALREAGVEARIPAPDGEGSVVVVRRRCGKPTCRCARPGEPGHGPYAVRVYRDEWGKRRTEHLGRIRAASATPRRLHPPRPSPASAPPTSSPPRLPEGFLLD